MIYTVGSQKYLSDNRAPSQASLTMKRTQKFRLEQDFVYRVNLTENDTLFLVQSGCIEFEGKRIHAGNILYISKFLKFHFLAVEPTELYEIAFDYSAPLFPVSQKTYTIKAPLNTQELFHHIYRGSSACGHLPGVNEGLLLCILNTLHLLCGSYPVELSLYQKCHDWIEQNAARSINAESAAEAMNCTVAHLNRTVKKYSSKCLSQLITEARISAIKQFVRFSNLSTQEIALRLEFGSSELLRKFFKYHTGFSLKEYKKTE